MGAPRNVIGNIIDRVGGVVPTWASEFRVDGRQIEVAVAIEPPTPQLVMEYRYTKESHLWKETIAFRNVRHDCQSYLSKIALATNLFCLGLGLIQCGQQHRSKNSDNGDNHEQFNQRERSITALMRSAGLYGISDLL